MTDPTIVSIDAVTERMACFIPNDVFTKERIRQLYHTGPIQWDRLEKIMGIVRRFMAHCQLQDRFCLEYVRSPWRVEEFCAQHNDSVVMQRDIYMAMIKVLACYRPPSDPIRRMYLVIRRGLLLPRHVPNETKRIDSPLSGGGESSKEGPSPSSSSRIRTPMPALGERLAQLQAKKMDAKHTRYSVRVRAAEQQLCLLLTSTVFCNPGQLRYITTHDDGKSNFLDMERNTLLIRSVRKGITIATPHQLHPVIALCAKRLLTLRNGWCEGIPEHRRPFLFLRLSACTAVPRRQFEPSSCDILRKMIHDAWDNRMPASLHRRIFAIPSAGKEDDNNDEDADTITETKTTDLDASLNDLAREEQQLIQHPPSPTRKRRRT